MEQADFNRDLFDFLKNSPTPYHAVAQVVQRLRAAGFQPLQEVDAWALTPGGRYYVVRNGSSIVAFVHGALDDRGIRMVGAHTDSPCLRVKPNPEINSKGYFQLGVEVYGGALLAPWFDRDLSIAGRVGYLDEQGRIGSALVNFAKPIAVIPSLAIHLDREANSSRSINPQRELPPILLQLENEHLDFRTMLALQLKDEHPDLSVQRVLDYELSLYDTQPPSFVGLREEFIASARLDNLLSCYIGLRALVESETTEPALLVLNDHEEVGSQSAEGAQGPFLASVLERICPDGEARQRGISRSLFISADNAHGVHPNFADRHDANHGPLLNRGPVIKINANQRYATSSETSSLYRVLSERLGLPCQSFVVRTDMACGSTIGPITAGNIGVRTLDIGVPQFAMHSIRELAGSEDAYNLFQVLTAFFAEDQLI